MTLSIQIKDFKISFLFNSFFENLIQQNVVLKDLWRSKILFFVPFSNFFQNFNVPVKILWGKINLSYNSIRVSFYCSHQLVVFSYQAFPNTTLPQFSRAKFSLEAFEHLVKVWSIQTWRYSSVDRASFKGPSLVQLYWRGFESRRRGIRW